MLLHDLTIRTLFVPKPGVFLSFLHSLLVSEVAGSIEMDGC